MFNQSLPIHYAFQWVKAEKGRRSLPTVSHYMNREQERFIHDRHPVFDKASYIQRLNEFKKGVKDVIGVIFRSNNSHLSSKEIWDQCDRLARRKDGMYALRGGHMPRLACFGDAFIGYTELSEDQKVEIITELVENTVEKYGCAIEAVMHSRDSLTIDHFHLLMTDRVVDEVGVGAKIRETNGIFSKIAGDAVIEGKKRYAGHMEWQRDQFAGLLRRHTGMNFRSESYERQGKNEKPVKYISKKRVYLEKRLGTDTWRSERRNFLLQRAHVHIPQQAAPQSSSGKADERNLSASDLSQSENQVQAAQKLPISHPRPPRFKAKSEWFTRMNGILGESVEQASIPTLMTSFSQLSMSIVLGAILLRRHHTPLALNQKDLTRKAPSSRLRQEDETIRYTFIKGSANAVEGATNAILRNNRLPRPTLRAHPHSGWSFSLGNVVDQSMPWMVSFGELSKSAIGAMLKRPSAVINEMRDQGDEPDPESFNKETLISSAARQHGAAANQDEVISGTLDQQARKLAHELGTASPRDEPPPREVDNSTEPVPILDGPPAWYTKKKLRSVPMARAIVLGIVCSRLKINRQDALARIGYVCSVDPKRLRKEIEDSSQKFAKVETSTLTEAVRFAALQAEHLSFVRLINQFEDEERLKQKKINNKNAEGAHRHPDRKDDT